MPHGLPVQIQNRRFLLTMTPLDNQVKVDLVEVKGGPAPAIP
jgi:hypothetical protein